jgi:hypothetical protein
MAFIAEQRIPLIFGLVSLGILLVIFCARVCFGKPPDIEALASETDR